MENKPDIIKTIHAEGFEPKRKGRAYWLCCPFHDDKTPSFKVDPARQTFHCFGCGEHGDAISFIQKLHGLSFKDALRYLGIENGKQPQIDHRRRKKRELVKAFGEWRDCYYQELCSQRRTYVEMTRDLKTMDQVESMAWMLHELTLIEHRLNVLFNGSDEEKYMLFREVKENGKV